MDVDILDPKTPAPPPGDDNGIPPILNETLHTNGEWRPGFATTTMERYFVPREPEPVLEEPVPIPEPRLLQIPAPFNEDLERKLRTGDMVKVDVEAQYASLEETREFWGAPKHRSKRRWYFLWLR